MHDDKFLTSDYSSTPNKIAQETDYIGIAFILDLDDTNFHSFYDYQQSVGEIEKYNSEGGIRRTYIRYELYNCPVDSDKAAGLVVNLKVRGFELLVGGCNAKVKSYLSSTLNSIDSILFYTGLNPGGECIKNMYIYIYIC